MKKLSTLAAACVLYSVSWTTNWFPSIKDDLVTTLSYNEQQIRPLDKMKIKRQLRINWYTVYANWKVKSSNGKKFDLDKAQLYDEKIFIPTVPNHKSFRKKKGISNTGMLIVNPRYKWNLWNIHRMQDKRNWKRR